MKKVIITLILIGAIGGGYMTLNNNENFKLHNTSTVETQGFGSSQINLKINNVEVKENIDGYYSEMWSDHDGINENNTLNENYKFVVLSLDVYSKDNAEMTLNCIQLGGNRLSCDEEPVYSNIGSNNEHDYFKLLLSAEEQKKCEIGFLVKKSVLNTGNLVLKWNPYGTSFDENIRYIALEV